MLKAYRAVSARPSNFIRRVGPMIPGRASMIARLWKFKKKNLINYHILLNDKKIYISYVSSLVVTDNLQSNEIYRTIGPGQDCPCLIVPCLLGPTCILKGRAWTSPCLALPLIVPCRHGQIRTSQHNLPPLKPTHEEEYKRKVYSICILHINHMEILLTKLK